MSPSSKEPTKTTTNDSVDMSPIAIARRLDEVRRLNLLMRYLAMYRPER
jgi:hypothetical protein